MKKRFDNDAYFTRRRFDVDTLLDYLKLSDDVTCLEPCAGAGHISGLLPGHVFTNDIAPKIPMLSQCDATLAKTWHDWHPVDWVISNPPFNLANRIVPLAYEHARKGVAMLLRLTWLEPTEGRNLHGVWQPGRAKWLRTHPLSAQLVLPRFSFDGSGNTDSVTCAWMIWDKSKPPAIHVFPYDEEKAGQSQLFTV